MNESFWMNIRFVSRLPDVGAVILAMNFALLGCSAKPDKINKGKVESKAGRGMELAAGEPAHVYDVELRAGELVHLRVQQAGIDVDLALLDPGGVTLRRKIDTMTGNSSPEEIWWIARRSGHHTLQVIPLKGVGTYSIEVEIRPHSFQDALFVDAQTTRLAGQESKAQGDVEAAIRFFQESCDLWCQTDDKRRLVLALARWGDAEMYGPGKDRAIRHYHEALRVLQELPGEERQEVRLLNSLGMVLRETGRLQEAEAAYQEALTIARAVDFSSGTANALNNLAVLFYYQGRAEESLDCSDLALQIWRALGNGTKVAHSLQIKGSGHLLLKQWDKALRSLTEALRIYRDTQDRRSNEVLTAIGWSYHLRGDPKKALGFYRQAEELIGYEHDMASLHDRIGTAYVALKDWKTAEKYYLWALAVMKRGEYRLDEAHTLNNLCRLELLSATPSPSKVCREALTSFRALKDADGMATALHLNARRARRDGDLHRARDLANESVDVLEGLRAGFNDPANKTAFMEVWHDYYELYLDILFDLQQRDPTGTWGAEALTVIERSRARSLVELLEAARIQLRNRADPAALDRPPLLDEVRKLLDAKTLFLAYALGEERSMLLLLGRDKVVLRELPPRRDIEGDANRWHRALAQPGNTWLTRRADTGKVLSDVLLQPVSEHLHDERLVILGDGILSYLPFQLLPKPGGTKQVVDDHEVVFLPSASTLMALRNNLLGRPPADGLVAVVADPVFTASDERFGHAGPEDDGGGAERSRLHRLPSSHEEALSILGLAPSGASTTLLEGFDARRDRVLGGALHGYRIVHFATHGEIRTDQPERSSIVLSRFDRAGRPLEGNLSLRDVYNLDLPSELVVLSACQTALGSEVRGEGIIGLTRGFMYAGVPRVLVSLWDVEDQATAVLMKRFYRALLHDKLGPAAALRKAQLSMRDEGRWQPYHWAGFVLQGEWRRFDVAR